MTRYAATTDVSVDRSRAEIEKILQRYGAGSFLYGWQDDQALIMFKMHNRQIKFVLTMPDRNDFLRTPGRNQRRTEKQVQEKYDQACRQRWRALALVIKAKLEAVESGITTFDDEFMAATMLPDGQTVGQWMQPQIEATYQSGSMPKMLPLLEDE